MRLTMDEYRKKRKHTLFISFPFAVYSKLFALLIILHAENESSMQANMY
jgi:hypothetical protein